MKTINKRVEELERKQPKQSGPGYVIVEDGEPIPPGIKAYSPEANPDLWDEPIRMVKHEKNN